MQFFGGENTEQEDLWQRLLLFVRRFRGRTFGRGFAVTSAFPSSSWSVKMPNNIDEEFIRNLQTKNANGELQKSLNIFDALKPQAPSSATSNPTGASQSTQPVTQSPDKK